MFPCRSNTRLLAPHGMDKPLSSASTCLHSGIPFLLYSFCSGGRRPLSSSVVEPNTTCRPRFFSERTKPPEPNTACRSPTHLPAGSRRWPEPNSTSRIPRPPPRSSTPGCSSRPPRFARPHRQDPDAASRSPTPLPGVRRLAAAPGSWVCSSSPAVVRGRARDGRGGRAEVAARTRSDGGAWRLRTEARGHGRSGRQRRT
jgi:hypothetical protein